MFELNKEEIALIKATRDSKISPIAVMIGTRNGFTEHNKNGQWDEVIDIWDKYLESLVTQDEEDEF
ncbi:hypothetical protein D3C87_766340 [compost metagenome]